MPTFERAGETIAWESRGAGGTPLVLAHNLLTDRAVWAPVADRLAGTRRVLLVDLRGHGASSARARFTTRDLADDLAALLDAAGVVGPADVAGVSLGASAAAELALAAPARVRRLALLGVDPRRATRADALRNTLFAGVVRCAGWRSFVRRAVEEALLGATFRREQPGPTRAVVEGAARMSGPAAWRAVRCWVRRASLLERLRGLACPTLVVAGEEDPAAPPAVAEEVVARVRGARLVRLAATGHTIPLERPSEVAALLADHRG